MTRGTFVRGHDTRSPRTRSPRTRRWAGAWALALLAMIAGTLVGVSPAHAEQWAGSEAIPSPTPPVSTSVVDTDASGHSAAVWRTSSAVMVSRRQPGGGWSAPDSWPWTGGTPSVAVFVTSTTTTVVWRVGGTTPTIHSASAPHGQPWGETQTLSSAAGNTGAAFAALDDGTVLAAWSNGAEIAYARLGMGGTWSAASGVPSLSGTSTLRLLTTDPSGRAHLFASSQPAGGTHTLWSTTLASGAWTPPAAFSNSAVSISAVDAGVGADGTQHVTWAMGSTATTTQIRYAQRVNGAAWASGALLANSTAEAPVAVAGAQVGVEPNGSATVFWRSGTGASATIRARTRSAAGTWAATTVIGAAGNYSPPVAMVAANGTTHVTWQLAGAIQSRRRAAGATAWGATNTVGTGQTPAGTTAPLKPTLSTDSDGNLLYGWSVAGTSPGLRVRAFDNAGPYPTVSSIPATARVGDVTGMTQEARDAWLDPATVTWSFDDSTQTATGTSITHMFATPGTRTVTVTLTDSFGHSRAVRHTVEVLPATVLPTLSAFSLKPRKVRLRAPKKKRVLRATTTVDYNGTLHLTFKRKVVVKTKKGRKKKLRTFAKTDHPVRAGANTIKIGRRPGGKKLKPGTYVVIATAGMNTRKAKFRVVR